MSSYGDRCAIGASSGQGKCVLVVDDEHVIRDILKRTLEREGFRVVTATDGMDALEKLNGTNVDVVISDVLMPIMDGLEFLVQVKCDFPNIPVIFITGQSKQFTGKQALEAGAEDYIVKPFRNQDIRLAMQRVTSRLDKTKRARK